MNPPICARNFPHLSTGAGGWLPEPRSTVIVAGGPFNLGKRGVVLKKLGLGRVRVRFADGEERNHEARSLLPVKSA